MNIFSSLQQGDSTTWLDDPVTDAQNRLLTSSAYTLTYTLAGPIAAPLAIIATANGNGWKTTLGTAASAGLVPGTYWWSAALTGSGERITLGTGEAQILANLASAGANYDGRSVAEIALADAEAALSTFRASHGRTRSYTIGTRNMQFESAADILVEINFWKIRVGNERSAQAIANGLGNPRKLFVRFA